jgi:DNA-binding MarR family transcriptional regulator
MPERAKIVELIDRLSRIAHSLQFAEGLNPAQWEALRYVARANRNSCSPGALADFMGSTKGTVSQTLKSLEKKGLIRRKRRDGDRRSVQISVTVNGHSVLRKDPLIKIHDALAPCDRNMQCEVVSAMERLLDAVHLHQRLPEFGPCLDCTHYKAEECTETNSLGCRCGVSGDLFSALEIDRICADFSPALQDPQTAR